MEPNGNILTYLAAATPSVLPPILLTPNKLLQQLKKRTHTLGTSKVGQGRRRAWSLSEGELALSR